MGTRVFVLFTVLALISASATCEPVRCPVGEQLAYRILWGFVPVGRAVITCDPAEETGTPLIRIRVEVKSNRIISALYPVDDRIECYVDPATGLPLRVEKKTSEGGFVCDDTLVFDRENLQAHWHSRSASITTNYTISSNTLDVSTFLYALRSVPFALNESKVFKIAVDGYLHGLTITAEEKKRMDVGSEKEKRWCTRFSAVPERRDLFVRKIPGDIWVTDGEPSILVQMKTKTPVGPVTVVLDENQFKTGREQLR